MAARVEYVRYVKDDGTVEDAPVRTLSDTLPSRRVVGDSPAHGKHLIWDSRTDVYAECSGGLAFAVGVACIEAEIARDSARVWKVCHPNGTELYFVTWIDTGQIIVTKVY